MAREYDAVVVGAGPNGLSAAIKLAQHQKHVLVLEAADEVGGGARTAELTLPGFLHDVCSAVHPLGAGSPFFRSLPLSAYGLDWIHPDVMLSHPLSDGTTAALYRSVDKTSVLLGADGAAYRRAIAPLVKRADRFTEDILGPIVSMPKSVLARLRFGVNAFRSATSFSTRFETEHARALIAGLAAHAVAPLNQAFTAGVALVLASVGHAFGWPIARGGSKAISLALTAHLRELGGEVVTGQRVTAVRDLPAAKAYLFDVVPGDLVDIALDRLDGRQLRSLTRWRHGPGVFKIDWALREPIPWSDSVSRRAGTIHVGGTANQIADAERAAWDGQETEEPFVLVVQPSVFDPSRAPTGRHTAWAYCHVPNGSTVDMTQKIEARIEKFAPGFASHISGRHTMKTADLAAYNANYRGGDISGGAFTPRQLFARPGLRLDPYDLGNGIYLCSSAAPPGAGVHGMCGYHAARSALKGVLAE